MIPGLNSRDMMKAMKKLGVKQEEIPATEVIIRCEDKEIIITQPEVLKIDMMGQKNYQISGNAQERPLNKEIEISQEDIKTVMEQANVNEQQALETIKKHKGDLASAILELTS